MDVGSHCSLSSCNALDFLPVPCDHCRLLFCRSKEASSSLVTAIHLLTPGTTFLPPLTVALRLLNLLSQGLSIHNRYTENGALYMVALGQTELHHNDTHVQ